MAIKLKILQLEKQHFFLRRTNSVSRIAIQEPVCVAPVLALPPRPPPPLLEANMATSPTDWPRPISTSRIRLWKEEELLRFLLRFDTPVKIILTLNKKSILKNSNRVCKRCQIYLLG